MNIRNYDDVCQTKSGFKQIKPFMPLDTFTMLLCGPRNCGKTNLLMNILLEPCVYFDELYVYAKNLHQVKYQDLMKKFDEIAKNNNIKNPAHFSNDKIIPVTQLSDADGLQ